MPYSSTILADFGESLHPRDSHGRFGEGDGEKQTQDKPAWRPTMSVAEAEKWAADSVVQGPLYHGTGNENTYNIEQTGFKTSEDGKFGPGVYLTPDWDLALQYAEARSASIMAVVETRVNLQNPMTTEQYLNAWQSSLEAKPEPGESKLEATNRVYDEMTAGYDGVVGKSVNDTQAEVVVFNPRSVVVVAVHA